MFVTRQTIFVLSVLVFNVDCMPASDVQILKYENNLRLDGYDFAYETSDSIRRSENGQLKLDKDEEFLDVNGEFSFVFPDGTPISVTFVASENGYRPSVVIGQRSSKAQPGPIIASRPIPTAAIASLAGGGLG